MTPPRASDQESLWLPDYFVCTEQRFDLTNSHIVVNSVITVDQAILKMMEKGDE